MANCAAILPALLIAMIPFIIIIANADEDARKDSLDCEIQEMKTRIAQLDRIRDIKIQRKSTFQRLMKYLKLIEDMTDKVNVLETTLRDLRLTGQFLKKLREDVEVLWATSRKNNFDIHVLESKLQEASVRLKALTAQVEKTTNIATELWIQIRHLEQALQITETRILKARRRRMYAFCKVWVLDCKVIKESLETLLSRIILVLDPGYFVEESPLRTYLSQALDQFKVILSATKNYHHKLQEFIKQKMEGNELTAPLANQEVVFFLASVAVTFPTLMAVKFLGLCLKSAAAADSAYLSLNFDEEGAHWVLPFIEQLSPDDLANGSAMWQVILLNRPILNKGIPQVIGVQVEKGLLIAFNTSMP
ncbi:hypothetical protein Sjap_000342 [Stephania japonica]|uniref:Uncharacterized protein n=1 Tax=Stephania japonica TaxID=461633 RepID=A0AAP0KHV8_9MAGN